MGGGRDTWRLTGRCARTEDPLADTLAEVEVVTHGDLMGDANALKDSLAGTIVEVEAVTHGDKPSNAQSLCDTMAD